MFSFFFFNDTATTEIYTLSLHDALPILSRVPSNDEPISRPAAPAARASRATRCASAGGVRLGSTRTSSRSEEHTSELQSRSDLVCRLLLEKKKRHHTRAVTILGLLR